MKENGSAPPEGDSEASSKDKLKLNELLAIYENTILYSCKETQFERSHNDKQEVEIYCLSNSGQLLVSYIEPQEAKVNCCFNYKTRIRRSRSLLSIIGMDVTIT